ncbi:hypothetical protein Tco_1389249, partial [Tanacetum coccineum]
MKGGIGSLILERENSKVSLSKPGWDLLPITTNNLRIVSSGVKASSGWLPVWESATRSPTPFTVGLPAKIEIMKNAADIRKIKIEQAGKQQDPKYTIVSSGMDHKALYHALMESILKDKDAMDKGVANKLKKRKPDDIDKDEG